MVVVKGVATTMPAGKLSVNVMPAAAVEGLAFVIVNVKVEVPPVATGLGENALLMVGG